MSVLAFEFHGRKAPDAGEDTTPPVATVTPVDTLGSTASFDLTANEAGVTFECQLTKNGKVTEAWARCTSPKTYSRLKPGTYVLFVNGTDPLTNVHESPGTYSWSVKKGSGR